MSQQSYRSRAGLGDWRVKAMLVFGIASSTEGMQAFGAPLLGRTFDPLDFVMFGGGVGLAVVVDQVLLSRLLRRGHPKAADPCDAARPKALSDGLPRKRKDSTP